MEEYARAIRVTDYIEHDDLKRVMHNTKEFGHVSHYRVLNDMIVETSADERHLGISPSGLSNDSARLWKFVRLDDGWEVYEVSRSGKAIGNPFRIDV